MGHKRRKAKVEEKSGRAKKGREVGKSEKEGGETERVADSEPAGRASWEGWRILRNQR